jgi:hypothetical protein
MTILTNTSFRCMKISNPKFYILIQPIGEQLLLLATHMQVNGKPLKNIGIPI